MTPEAVAAKASEPLTLNLGSGRRYIEGAVNLDVTPARDPDVVHDLESFPWPFDDQAFGRVVAFDVIEHLSSVLKTMEEIHRVCRQGARIEIAVPHFSSANAFTDPTHRHYFGARSFDYFTGESIHDYYTDVRFRMVRREVIFRRTAFNRVVGRLANRHLAGWEDRWAWMFPAVFLSFELEVV